MTLEQAPERRHWQHYPRNHKPEQKGLYASIQAIRKAGYRVRRHGKHRHWVGEVDSQGREQRTVSLDRDGIVAFAASIKPQGE